MEHGVEGGPYNKNYTEALFKALVLTKSTSWVRACEACLQTAVWETWLERAEEEADRSTSIMAPLAEQRWPGHNQNYGVVWQRPAGFSPKELWDNLAAEAAYRKNQSGDQSFA